VSVLPHCLFQTQHPRDAMKLRLPQSSCLDLWLRIPMRPPRQMTAVQGPRSMGCKQHNRSLCMVALLRRKIAPFLGILPLLRLVAPPCRLVLSWARIPHGCRHRRDCRRECKARVLAISPRNDAICLQQCCLMLQAARRKLQCLHAKHRFRRRRWLAWTLCMRRLSGRQLSISMDRP
jgi:hypothetical protein